MYSYSMKMISVILGIRLSTHTPVILYIFCNQWFNASKCDAISVVKVFSQYMPQNVALKMFALHFTYLCLMKHIIRVPEDFNRANYVWYLKI